MPEIPPVETLTLADKSEHPVFDDDIAGWQEAFPGVDIVAELKKMKVWLDANPRRRKTKRGINAFIVSWLSRQQDRPRQILATPVASQCADDHFARAI